MTSRIPDSLGRYLARPINVVVSELESYADLLRKWQVVQNLVSRETLDDVWSRHFIDSLQVLPLLTRADNNFVDLGSGGGLPAIPLAIALKGASKTFHLVEPNQRKVSFLRTVARELQLAIHVHPKRSDQLDSRETLGDVFTSRALASLTDLCGALLPLWQPHSRAILHKGRDHAQEVRSAATHFHFDVLTTPSQTSADGVLLTLTNLIAISAR